MTEATADMPRPTPDLPATTRILRLQKLLESSNRTLTKAELAEQLGCTVETVRRNLQTLEQELGSDRLITDRSERAERHSLQPPPQRASQRPSHPLHGLAEEVDLFAHWVELMAPHLPASLAERARRAIPRLAMALGEGGPGYSGTPQTTGPGATTFRSKGYIDYAPHSATLRALRDAIRERKVCLIDYLAAGRETPRPHRLVPRRIVAQSGTLYLLADLLADGMLLPECGTTLSVHRIRSVSLTGEYGPPAPEPDGSARHFGLKWHEPRRRSVWIAAAAADYVRDRIWSDDQTITPHADGSLTLHVTTTSEEELQAWVNSFSGRARLEETPQSIPAPAPRQEETA